MPSFLGKLKMQIICNRANFIAFKFKTMKRDFFEQFNLDALGFSASALCAVHCFAMPFVIALLPIVGLSFLAHPAFEATLLILGLVIGALSLSHGYFRHHRNFAPISVLSIGFSFIAIGHIQFFEDYEFLIVSSGACLVACSHLLNLRLMKHEKQCAH
jgi:hypothetical protein